jgi:hypothetical protein
MMGATGFRSHLSAVIRSQRVAVSAPFPDFTAAPIKSDPDVRQHDHVDMASDWHGLGHGRDRFRSHADFERASDRPRFWW